MVVPVPVSQWTNLAAKYARMYGVPLSVVLGIMDIESGGNPSARSKAGAMGLMQVMPSNFSRGENGMDPETNIRKGVEMLASRYKTYGNWDSAAASYFGAVNKEGNPTTAKDVNGVSGVDYVRQFKLASSRYGGVDMGDGDRQPPSAEEGYWNTDVRGPGNELVPSDGGGARGGGIDSTIADLYKQRQIEKQKVDRALAEWQKEEAAAKGALQGTARPFPFAPGTPEYSDAVERVNQATSKVAYYKTASQQLIDSLQKLEADYVSATNKAATQALQYANKAAAAGLQGRKDYLAEAIALGRISTDQARLAWDQAQDTAKDWMTAVQQGYSAAALLLPKMAFQEDIDALWEDLKNVKETTRYSPSGPPPRGIPLEAVLVPYMDAIKQYMPPMNAIDWKKVMQVPEGLGTPTISLPEYTEGARAQLAMPAEIAPLPTGGYTGGEEFVAGPPARVVPPPTPMTPAEQQADQEKKAREGGVSQFSGYPPGSLSERPGVGALPPVPTGYDWPELWSQMGIAPPPGSEGEDEEEGVIAPPEGVGGGGAVAVPSAPTAPSVPGYSMVNPAPGTTGAQFGEGVGGLLGGIGEAIGGIPSNWQSAMNQPETPLEEWRRLHPGQLPPRELYRR